MPSGAPPEEEDEAFIGRGDGEVDGEVLDDIDGEGMEPGSSSDAEDSGDVSLSGHTLLEDDSMQAFEGHQDAVLSVAWSPVQQDVAASGGQDDRAYLWRVGQEAYEQTGGTLSTFELAGHTDSVVALGFNASGTLLATGALDGTVRVWRAADGGCVCVLEGPGGGVEWLTWHPKGDVVLAGSEDFTMWMWLAQSGNCMQVFSGHSGAVAAGAFTPDGKAVLSVGGDGDCSLRRWNPKTGECTATLQGHPFHADALTCLAVHADGSVTMTGAQDGSLRVSNVGAGRVLAAPEGHQDSVEAVGFSAQLPLAASAGVDGKLVVWDCAQFSQRGVCQHEQAVTRLAWHPHQPLVASACLDGAARVWDLRTAGCVRQLGGHKEAIQDIAFSLDGNMLLTGADDHTARVFDLGASR